MINYRLCHSWDRHDTLLSWLINPAGGMSVAGAEEGMSVRRSVSHVVCAVKSCYCCNIMTNNTCIVTLWKWSRASSIVSVGLYQCRWWQCTVTLVTTWCSRWLLPQCVATNTVQNRLQGDDRLCGGGVSDSCRKCRSTHFLTREYCYEVQIWYCDSPNHTLNTIYIMLQQEK